MAEAGFTFEEAVGGSPPLASPHGAGVSTAADLIAKPPGSSQARQPGPTTAVGAEGAPFTFEEATAKQGFWANLKMSPQELWEGWTQKSLPANMVKAVRQGFEADPSKTPQEFATTRGGAVTGIARGRREKSGPSEPVDWQGLVDKAMEDPGKMGAEFLNALATDPWMLMIPGGMGGKVTETLVAVAEAGGKSATTAARILGKMAEAGTMGGAAMGAISAAEQAATTGKIDTTKLGQDVKVGATLAAPFGLLAKGERVPKPKEPPAREQIFPGNPDPLEVQRGIDERLGIKTPVEAKSLRGQRQTEIRAAFKEDKDMADFLRTQAESEHGSREHERQLAAEADAELKVKQSYEVQGAKPVDDVSPGDLLRILRKPRFERTATDLIQLKAAMAQGALAVAGITVASQVLDEDQLKTLGGATAMALAVKPKGGMWHPEAVERLSAPLKDKLVPDRPLAPLAIEAWKNTPSGQATAWADKAIRNYLNKHAGTESDPLKDVEIPFGEGTKKWEEVTAKAIGQPYKSEQVPALGARPGENIWNIGGHAQGTAIGSASEQALKSYISHAGDFARQNIPPEKLQQYDFVRLIKETATNDARVAKEMEKSTAASMKDMPVYKDYGDGMKWVELKLPEKLTEEQAKGIRKATEADIGVDARGNPEATGWEYIAQDAKGNPIKNSYTGDLAGGHTPEEAFLAGQLAQEGNQLGHCVGGYCAQVASGKSKIYSLRDAKGRSHVTVEVTDAHYGSDDISIYPTKYAKEHNLSTDLENLQDIESSKEFSSWVAQQPSHIAQIKGKQNRAPIAEYLPYVQDFVKGGKWGEVGDLENTGLKATQYGYLTIEEITQKRLQPADDNAGGIIYRDARFPPGQRGEIHQQLLNRMAAIGLGALAGSQLDPKNSIEGALIGALAGRVLLSGPNAIKAIKRIASDTPVVNIDHLVKNWQANRFTTARAAWQMQAKLEQLVPDTVGREKITHWLDGDKSINLKPNEMNAAQRAEAFFRAMSETGLDSGALSDVRKNYVTHLLDYKKTSSEVWNLMRSGGGQFSTNSPFSKERVNNWSLKRWEAEGYTPITKDISAIVGIYANSMGRAIENRNLIKAMKEFKGPDGGSVIAKADKAPLDWVAVNHPQLTGQKVHPDIAPLMEHVFEANSPGLISKALLAVSVGTKRLAVSLNLFHAKALTDAYISAGGNMAKIPSIMGGESHFQQMFRGGKQGDLVDIAGRAGLTFSFPKGAPTMVEDVASTVFKQRDIYYAIMQDVSKFADSIIPGADKLVGQPLQKASHAMDEFMWARTHAGMKLQVFADNYQMMLKKNPSMPQERVAEMAASYANDLFGGINWTRAAMEAKSRLGRGIAMQLFAPAGRRAMQILTFAPDWTISTTRAMARAFSDKPSFQGMLNPKVQGDLHRRYLLGAAIYYGTVANALNYAFTGHSVFDNKDPTVIELGDGRTMQWSKHTMEPVHWLTKPGQQALNKLSAVVSEPAQQAMGVEYLSTTGKAPRMDKEAERSGESMLAHRAKHAAKRLLPIPVQQFDKGSPGSAVSGFFGVPIYGKPREQIEKERAERKLKRSLENRTGSDSAKEALKLKKRLEGN